MKTLYIALFSLVWSLGAAAQTMRCEGLFSETSQTLQNKLFESKRLSLVEMADDKMSSKLIVEASPFSDNINEATLEILRMLVQNSDFKLEGKTVLIKNKFTLAIPLKDGYFFEATYESKSNVYPRFVLQDKLVLVSPTGKVTKVTDDLIDADELKIKKSDFSLSDLSVKGLEIHLRIPLVIEGQLLSRMTKLASYFAFFEKSEIARIVEGENITKINTMFRLRKAKYVFINVLIKQPFKSLISGVIMFAAINGQSFFPHSVAPDSSATFPTAITQSFLQKTINNFQVPEKQVKLKTEISALYQKASALMKSKSYSGLSPYDINLNSQNIFSREHNMFVYYKKNEVSGQQQTFIVFANDISNGSIQGLQYFAVEVNAAEFQTLINYINHQGQPPVGTN